ncbi:hypothetical protein F2P56_021188 [Juglans regia]|uniref:Uncharacterized protein n=1 Tax=Juglans regia TaxID=51240 RepID=A0A833UFM8_JUGRE|nr:hypothetical protein F2P56_021188 [Juglans regia]
MVMMLLLAIIVVQAQEVSPPPSPGSPSLLSCPVKCALKCLPSIEFGHVKYGLCVSLCLIECMYSPLNAVVYDCTEKCAVFKTITFKPDSYDEVGSYVESCYEGCSNKSSTVGHGF